MKQLIVGLLLISFCISCSKTNEGLLGEWEGTTERVSNGNLVESTVKCTISSNSNSNRNVSLSVAGALFEFSGLETNGVLRYKDEPILNDTLGITYISGNAELQNDTLLHFEHIIYEMRNGAVLTSNKESFDLVRK